MEEKQILPRERSEESFSDEELLNSGREVLLEESRAIKRAAERAGEAFVKAARLVTACKGRVVVSGLGKSGLVGRKIAATFASLGIPAFFLHAAEGAHGDLGMVCPEDVGLFISNSGETEELLALLPYFRKIGAAVVAMTGHLDSSLAKNSDVCLDSGVEREADPLGLAPTASTSVQMALGDAIAGISVKLRCLRPEDFALFHPGGALGKRLLLRVEDLMGSEERMPVTLLDSTVREALFEITSKGYGATAVVDAGGALQGVFTDGDLRRLLERRGVSAMDLPVTEGMTKTPHTIPGDRLAVEAMRVMEELEISVLIVMRESRPLGMVHLHDILRAGVS